MARDATLRLYDVNDHTVIFEKLNQTKKYDQGTITFAARPGKLIDLNKLFESIWATRLSRGTRSGLIELQVTAVGEVVNGDEVILQVKGSNDRFRLLADSKNGKAFAELRDAAARGQAVSVTGILDGWRGRWPGFLRKPPPGPRKIVVSSFQTVK